MVGRPSPDVGVSGPESPPSSLGGITTSSTAGRSRIGYSRDVINQIAKTGGKAKVGTLDETDAWTRGYFAADNPKRHKREMFFRDTGPSWSDRAAGAPDAFKGERRPPAI